MVGVLKQIKIIEDENLKTVEEDVNSFLAELCNDGIDPDNIKILCNITLSGGDYIYYTYTIIYEEA